MWYVAAVGFTLAVGALRFAVPWNRGPPLVPGGAAAHRHGCDRVPDPLGRTRRPGLGSLLLLPLLYSAFYGAQWESYVLIPAIALTQGLIGQSNNDSGIVLTRLLVFWVALLVMISVAAHALRRHLQATVDNAKEEARQSAVVAEATRSLTTSLDPSEVVQKSDPPGGRPGVIIQRSRRTAARSTSPWTARP